MKRKRLPVFRERHAEIDFTGHILRLLGERPSAAARFVDAVEAAFERLSTAPEVGVRRKFENPRLEGLRMWPVPGFKNYLIFYRVTSERVEVLRILHAARDVAGILEGF